MGFIKTTGLKGSRKQEMRFELRNETGKQVFGVTGEVETLKSDKRRKRGRDYVTLAQLSRNPRFILTYSLSSHKYSILYQGGVHWSYLILDDEASAKIGATHTVLESYDKDSFSKNVIIQEEEDKPPYGLLLNYYRHTFTGKITEAKKRRRKEWQLRKARRNRGAPPPYDPHRHEEN